MPKMQRKPIFSNILPFYDLKIKLSPQTNYSFFRNSLFIHIFKVALPTKKTKQSVAAATERR